MFYETNLNVTNKVNLINMRFICEDFVTKFVVHNEGLSISRKSNNLSSFDFSKENTMVCLTGYSSILNNFFNSILAKFAHPVTLIIIESDVIHLNPKWLENEKISKCYTWNKPFNHEKLYALPIGLNYERQYKVLQKWLSSHGKQNIQKDKMLAVNHSPNTNSIRGTLSSIASTQWNEFCDVLNYIPPAKTYWQESKIEGKIRITVSDPKCYDVMSQYKFILCPAGAGEDTHRTWEALYIGCIPIVKTSHLDELYEDLPIVIVSDWHVITREFLESKYEEIQNVKKRNNVYKYEKVCMEYWFRMFRPPVIHFMTYANDVFEHAKSRLLKEASDFGEFKTVQGYGPSDLDTCIYQTYKSILELPRGGGYWLWRPFILQEKMSQIQNGEYIVFLDAGCKLNSNGKKRFNEYINQLAASQYGILSFQMSGNNGPGTLCKEKVWTINEIFQYFNVQKNEAIHNSGQYLGGVFILKKCSHSQMYIEKTIECISKNPLLITDYFNKQNQATHFKENRHEQSVTSVLRKIIGSEVIDGDESWWPPFGTGESLNYPFWATRSKQ